MSIIIGTNQFIHKVVTFVAVAMMASLPLLATITPVSALYLSNEPTSEGLEYTYNSDGTATVKEWTNNNNLLAGKSVSVPDTVSKDGKVYNV